MKVLRALNSIRLRRVILLRSDIRYASFGGRIEYH